VASAQVNSPLFRGFEQILAGKHPHDALTIVPRICGICSVAQSAACASALAAVAGVRPRANGQVAAALTLAIENVADHLSHFVLFFMPDFARAEYADRPWYDEAAPRFRAIAGAARRVMMPARTRLLHTLGLLAGKWPHTGSLQPGGSAQPVGTAERLQLFALVRDFRAYCEAEIFGDRLEAVAALDSPPALEAWRQGASRGDAGRFLRIADDLDLWSVGRAADRFLSYGAYRIDDRCLFPAGVWDGGAQPLDHGAITEDVSHAWLGGEVVSAPAQGVTVPVADKEGGYTWCKAPRLGGRVMEVGALARQMVAGQPLVRAIVARHGGSVAARVLARLLEIAQLVPTLEQWVLALQPSEPFCDAVALPDEGAAAGCVEAARGALGHWITVRAGRIAGYQIIAPTTWNFSPRDRLNQPGALEAALVGLAMPDDGAVPARVQHVVRSFDPCMVCTVH
jgi:hydrogenase large subunit